MSSRLAAVHRLGTVRYGRAAELQRQLERLRLAGDIPETILVLEHPPVITLGNRGRTASLLARPATLEGLGVELQQSSRGGDATYHGPGQVVLYTIVSLGALRLTVAELVHALEESMIQVAGAFGVDAARLPGKPGVFVGRNKVGAVGLHVSRGVTTHGLAMNVDPDLSHFELIVPCGLEEHGVCSLSGEAGQKVDQREVEDRLVGELARQLGLDARERALPELAAAVDR